jgi:hypothetical protein
VSAADLTFGFAAKGFEAADLAFDLRDTGRPPDGEWA